MKTLITLLLAGSLVLNAALFIVLATGATSRETTAAKPALPAVKTSKPPGPQFDPNAWPTLSAGDLPALVTRLRAAGFPPAITRAIVSAQLQEMFAARRKAIDPQADTRPFWKSTTLDMGIQSAMRQMYREQQKMLRDLLGPDAEPDDPMSRARDARQFGHLPPEKTAEARRIVREFNDLRSDMYSGLLGAMTTADREKLAALERQQTAELKKIMTPREFDDYELRGSNTANNLRYQLAAFDPTEAEFRALFQLQRGFDDRFSPMYGQPSQEEMRLRGEAQRQLTEQIKTTLGPVRAAEYERATNYEYRTTSQLVARLELPPATTNQVYEVQKSIMDRMNTMFRSSTPAEREARMAELAAEAQTRVTAILGARGFEAYKQYGGNWMQALRPRSAPGTPVPGDVRVVPAR